MERYRVSLILAAPDYDTYGVLKAYAEHPCRHTYVPFRYLLHRVSRHVLWDSAAVLHPILEPNALMSLRLGCAMPTAASSSTDVAPADLEAMTDAERVDYYKACCACAGVDLDLEQLNALLDTNSSNEQ